MPQAAHFCPLFVKNPPPDSYHTPLTYFMPPLHSRVFWLWGLIRASTPLSLPTPSRLIQHAGRMWFLVKGRCVDCVDPALTPLYSDTFTRASTIYSLPGILQAIVSLAFSFFFCPLMGCLQWIVPFRTPSKHDVQIIICWAMGYYLHMSDFYL